jgi:hypothetical protein
MEVVTLFKGHTGIPGVIRLESGRKSVQPRLRWYRGRPLPTEPYVSVSIDPEPRVEPHGVAGDVETPDLAGWVKLNYADLFEYWESGSTWFVSEVGSFVSKLRKV